MYNFFFNVWLAGGLDLVRIVWSGPGIFFLCSKASARARRFRTVLFWWRWGKSVGRRTGGHPGFTMSSAIACSPHMQTKNQIVSKNIRPKRIFWQASAGISTYSPNQPSFLKKKSAILFFFFWPRPSVCENEPRELRSEKKVSDQASLSSIASCFQHLGSNGYSKFLEASTLQLPKYWPRC